ncbi:unnamed protein product, partial [Phaeothamnion confervicola]
LFQRLYDHPASFMGKKEMGFFLDKKIDHLTPEAAKAKYAKDHWWGVQQVEAGKRRGEITPNYQTQREIAPRVRRVLGATQRFVMMVRDPVKRAYSSYQMRLRVPKASHENFGSFERTIEEEYSLIKQCRKKHAWGMAWYTDCYLGAMPWVGILGHGFYYEHIMLWWQEYPPCSLMVLDQNDLNINGVDSCLYAHLDMQPYQFEAPQARRNVSADWIQADKYNKDDPMSSQTEYMLRELYRPHNDK